MGKVCNSNADCESENCDAGICSTPRECEPPAVGDLVFNEIFGRVAANEDFQLLPGVQQVPFIEIVNKSGKRVDLSGIQLIIDRRNNPQIDTIEVIKGSSPKCLAAKEALVFTAAPISGLPTGAYNVASLVLHSGSVFAQSAEYDLRLVAGEDVVIAEAYQPTTSATANQGVSRTRNPDVSGDFALHNTVGSDYKTSPGFCNNGELFINDCGKVADHCSNGVLDSDKGETDVDCGGPCPKCAMDKACQSNADCQSENCDRGICADPIPCVTAGEGDLVINEIFAKVAAGEEFQLLPGVQQVPYVEIVNKSGKRLNLSEIKLIIDRQNSTQESKHVLTKDGSPKCLAANEALVLTVAPISGLPTDVYNVASLTLSSGAVFAQSAEYDLYLVVGEAEVGEADNIIAEAYQPKTSSAAAGVSRTRNPDLSGAFELHSSVGSDLKTSPGFCNNGGLFINDCKLGGEEHCSNGVHDADKGETDVDCGGPCKRCSLNQKCQSNADCESENCDGGRCATQIECEIAGVGDLVINEILGRVANEAFQLLPGVQQVQYVEIVNKSSKRIALSEIRLISDRRNSDQVNEIVLIKDGSPRCLSEKETLVLTVAPISGLPTGVYNVTSLLPATNSVFVQSAEYDLRLVVGGELVIAEAEQLRTDSGTSNQGVSRTRNPDLDDSTAFVLHNSVGTGYKTSPGFCNNGALFINDCQEAADHCSNGVLDAAKGETDVDCGGPCKKCDNGQACLEASDCASGKCTDKVCVVAGCASDDECASGLVCNKSGSCVKLTIDGGKTISFTASTRNLLGEVYSANWSAGDYTVPASTLTAEIVCADAAVVLSLDLDAWETLAAASYTGTRNGNYYQFSGQVPRRHYEMYCLLAFSGDDGMTFKYATTEGLLKAGSDKLTSTSQALKIDAHAFKYAVTETFNDFPYDGSVQYGRTTNQTYTVNGAVQTLTALSGRLNWTANDSGTALIMRGVEASRTYILVEGLNAGVGSISFDCGDWGSTAPRKLEITVGSEVQELDLATCVAFGSGSTRKTFEFNNSTATSLELMPGWALLQRLPAAISTTSPGRLSTKSSPSPLPGGRFGFFFASLFRRSWSIQ